MGGRAARLQKASCTKESAGYVRSEAIDKLGVPTTAGLAIGGYSGPVYRGTPESAAVLTRLVLAVP